MMSSYLSLNSLFIGKLSIFPPPPISKSLFNGSYNQLPPRLMKVVIGFVVYISVGLLEKSNAS